MKSALIAAIVAAVVATASATAAVTVVITSKDIKNGTIQTLDISAKAKNALKGNRGPVGARGLTGAQGPAGAAGAQGPPGIQSLQVVINTISVAPSTTGDITATCPAGRGAVSGGFIFAGIVGASFNTGTGWRVAGFNDLTEATDISAVAYCSPNVTVTSPLVNSAKADLTLGGRRSAGE